jgi:ribosomal protein S13
MRLSELKSVNAQVGLLLEANDLTVEKLATATPRALTKFKGIGQVTAKRIIIEAGQLVNIEKADEARQMARQVYLQKAPTRKLVDDLIEEDGFSLQSLALAPVRALEGHKDIDAALAARIISQAQGQLNAQMLYEGRSGHYSGLPKETSAAFPVEWLSGQVAPPPMAIRVKRIFEQAKADYERAETQ